MSSIQQTSTSGLTFGSTPFVDRRQARPDSDNGNNGLERRQFGDSYKGLSEAGRELAEAIDSYKVQNRRRYVTTDELLSVIYSLGYSKG
jgi:hypothetical protein